MEFSEKDAARSKFKLTQRHSRGRGSGAGRGSGPAAGRGGRGGRGARRGGAPAEDLGSNQDRYRDHEAEAAAEAAALGPVQQSKGADLSQLLSQAEPFDRGFYYRARVNLAQELGLPPEPAGAGYQGLSIDLQGLDTCLELLPRNKVLETDVFSDDEEEDESNAGSEGSLELPDLDAWEAGGQPAQVGAAAAAEAAAAAAGPKHVPPPLGAAGRQREAWQQPGMAAAAVAAQPLAHPAAPAVPAVHAVPAAAAVAASAGGIGEVDDLLSELLGKKASIGSSVGHSGAAARHAPAVAAVAAIASRPPRPPAAAAGGQPGLAATQRSALQQQQRQQQQRQPPQARPQAQQAQQAAPADDFDDELDALLGIGSGRAASEGAGSASGKLPQPGSRAGGRTSLAAAPTTHKKDQSLDDWLDAL